MGRWWRLRVGRRRWIESGQGSRQQSHPPRKPGLELPVSGDERHVEVIRQRLLQSGDDLAVEAAVMPVGGHPNSSVQGFGDILQGDGVLMGRVSQIPERYQNAIPFDPAAQPSAEW